MWDSGLKIEYMIRDRARDIQTVSSRIREARYNKTYKEVGVGIVRPSYLRRGILDIERIGDKIRALLRLRCDNMEREKKYWMMEKEYKVCIFCQEGLDNRTLCRGL